MARIPQTLGSEGMQVQKGAHKGRSIAVFTSGGDSQGMNAAVRAVVRMGLFLGCKVYLIKEGYQGMVDGGDNFVQADWKCVSGIIHMGGTVIGSARCTDFEEREGRLKAAANLIEHSISSIVCVGGDGSLTGAHTFRCEWPELKDELVKAGTVSAENGEKCAFLNVVGIVGSIDNDFCGTDVTIGTDSALFRIVEAIDNISSTAFSHKRCFIVEVMGRHCGYLALISALAGEADYMFIPEWPPENYWETRLCNRLEQGRERGQRVFIVIVSEGAIDQSGQHITANQVKEVIVSRLNVDTRVTVLGHIQRGGCPSAFDRILGSRMGAEAVLALTESTPTTQPCVIAIDGNQIVRVPLKDAVQKTSECAAAVESQQYKEAVDLRGQQFKFILESYLLFSNVEPSMQITNPFANKRMAIINVGAPACGMNAAMRAFVRMVVTHKFKAIAVNQGFQGLLHDEIQHLKWNDVNGWSAIGGSAIRTSKVTPDQAGLQKVAEKFKKYDFSALLLIGGFEAYYSALVLAETRNKFQEFCIPIVLIPATINNNVPGTEFSVGSDTALNEIMNVCDRLKQSAQGSQNRTFVCETFGGYCGYLATLGALASGADAAYIYEEPYDLKDIQADAEHLVTKMKGGVQRGLVLRSERAHDFFSSDFVHRIYSTEGKNYFTTKFNIIGEIQEGGKPSPFDRMLAARFGVMCAEKLMTQILEYSNVAGVVNTKAAETCTVIGIHKRTVEFQPVQDLKNVTDFSHQLPTEQWWLKLRSLLRILAKHNSIYRRESVDKDLESTASHTGSLNATIVPTLASNFSTRLMMRNSSLHRTDS